jgi:hypothetical protein
MGKTTEIKLSISAVSPMQTQWVRYAITKEVGEREPIEEVQQEALNEVTGFFQKHFADYIQEKPETKIEPKQSIIEKRFLYLIQNAATEKELLTYVPLANKYPQLKTAYDNKLKQLNKTQP